VLSENFGVGALYRFFGLHISLLLSKMIIKHLNLNWLKVYIFSLISISPWAIVDLSTGKYLLDKHIKVVFYYVKNSIPIFSLF